MSNPEAPPCSVWQLWPFPRWTHLASQPYLRVPVLPPPYLLLSAPPWPPGVFLLPSAALSLSEVLSPVKSANTNPADQRIVNPKVTSGSNDVPETWRISLISMACLIHVGIGAWPLGYCSGLAYTPLTYLPLSTNCHLRARERRQLKKSGK